VTKQQQKQRLREALKMKTLKRFIVVWILVLLITSNVAAVNKVEIEGVSFRRALNAGGTSLELKGYGLLRYMVFIKAYVGALYMSPESAARNVLDPVAKRLELQYFHAIAAGDFDRATRIKIADNVTPAQLEKLRPRIDQLGAMFRDVKPSDRYGLTYIPGRGTELSLNGVALGSIPGSDFARAIFAVWLGDNPIDTDFRDVLLGAR
jgi:hypothetical protein